MTTTSKLLLAILLINFLSTSFSNAEEVHIKSEHPNQQKTTTLKINERYSNIATLQILSRVHDEDKCPMPTGKKSLDRYEYGFNVAKQLNPEWSKYDWQDVPSFYLRLNKSGEIVQSGIFQHSKSIEKDHELLESIQKYTFPPLPKNFWMETTDLVFTQMNITHIKNTKSFKESKKVMLQVSTSMIKKDKEAISGWYKNNLDKPNKYWKPFPDGKYPEKPVITTVGIKGLIDKEGKLLHHFVYKTSCNEQVDNYALEAVSKVKNFDKIPFLPKDGVFMEVQFYFGNDLIDRGISRKILKHK